MNYIYQFLSSSKLALVLLIIFSVSMGVATFIENDWGTTFSWGFVYNSWWFELVMLLLTISFITNIFKYKLYQKSKWAILLFHIAFVVIMIGAGITRYTSYTGIVRIREKSDSNTVITQDEYLKINYLENKTNKTHLIKVPKFKIQTSNFKETIEIHNHPLIIEKEKYIVDAIPTIQTSKQGTPILSLVVSSNKGKENIFLKSGESQSINQQYIVSFNKYIPKAINISWHQNQFKIHYHKTFDFYEMISQNAGVLEKNKQHPFQLKTLYRFNDLSIVANNFNPSSVIHLHAGSINNKNNTSIEDAVLFKIKYKGKTNSIPLYFKEGYLPTEKTVLLGNHTFSFSYGPKKATLPFKLYLNDFMLTRYPGSSSPSSYTSNITIKDGIYNTPYKIFMNNVLDYKGYRFYQASYDTDEQGTVLSVNYDSAGTFVTYLGYILMTIGMFFTLFGKKTRFRKLVQKLNNIPKIWLVGFLLLSSQFHFAATSSSKDITPMLQKLEVNPAQAQQFGEILVQDVDGRIKPINTLALELTRKITGKTSFTIPETNNVIKLDANQFFLSLQIYPEKWQIIPFIKIDYTKIKTLAPTLKVYKDKQISFANLLLPNGLYRLSSVVENINKKKPSERNEAENEVLKLDERFNILYNLFSGEYLKIFPNKLDKNHTWYHPKHNFENFTTEDGEFAKNVIPEYFYQISKQNYKQSTQLLNYIDTYQQVIAKEIIPTPNQVKGEILYNQANLNFWLFIIFILFGIGTLILALTNIFLNQQWIQKTQLVFNILIYLGFILFALNLCLRWFVAEHAPWSNGYEMLVFVAWILLLFAILFNKKSVFVTPLATLFTGILLLVSYLDWINPEITNLMPVLKSYWLKIHVAVIVSSYAPLALAALLSLMALILMNFKSNKNIQLRIKELSYLVEISITIGLFLLSIGTFLGGVWANESWGRYWAWDPKETWALISMMIYAVVLHLRLVPSLKSKYVLHVASMMAFWSIIMTSFGVNYYLKGLHSYASGDPIPIPNFVYITLFMMLVVAILPKISKNKKTIIS